MNKESPKSAPSERSSLALAGEWGITIAASTTIGALATYWLGRQLNQPGLTVLLVLLGIAGGFGLAVVRMLKVTERYVSSGTQSSPVQPPAHSSGQPLSSSVEPVRKRQQAPEPNYFTSEDEISNWNDSAEDK